MYDLMIFLRNLFIGLLVVCIPVGVMWLARMYKLNRAKKAFSNIPHEIAVLLRSADCPPLADSSEKLRYCSRTLLHGVGLYLLIVGIGIVRNLLTDAAISLREYLTVSVVLVPFILFFVLRDFLRTAPWAKVYRIPACPCGGFEKNQLFVCYYDFLKQEMETELVPVAVFSRTSAAGEIVRVLAVKRRKHLKVFHIVNEDR